MAVSINWATKVITIPQADLTPVSGSLYELDVDAFRLELKDIEDSDIGMNFPDTHRHSTQVTLAGTTYARTFEIINGYTVEFEDVGTPYTVRCVGANHNIGDVKTVNQVSLIIGNAAGLIVTSGEGGYTGPTTGQIAVAVRQEMDSNSTKLSVLPNHTTRLTLIEKILRNKMVTDPETGVMTIYDDDGVSVLLQGQIYESKDTSQAYRGKGVQRRERLS